MNHSWPTFQGVSPLEKQTAKMAEGPDPGQTQAKGEFGTFDKYKEKMSLEHFNSIFYCVYHRM